MTQKNFYFIRCLFWCLLLLSSNSVIANDDCFILKGPRQVMPVDQNCVPIRVSNLEDFSSLDFNISWSGLAHFDSITNVYSTMSWSTLSFRIDTSEVEDNRLGVSLMNLSPPLSFPDDAILFEICIDRASFTEDNSVLSFDADSPLEPLRLVEGEERGLAYFDGLIQLSGTSSDLTIQNLCTDYTFCDPLTGSIDLTPAGGTAPYTFAWNGPGGFTATSEDLPSDVLAEGWYSLTLSDAAGASINFNLDIIRPQVTPQTFYLNPVDCFGDSTGSIIIGPVDSLLLLNLNFAWSNGADTAAIDQLPAGIYTLTLTDELSCSWVKEFVMFEATEIRNEDAVFNCAGPGTTNGSIDLNLSGGFAPYSSTWSTGYNAMNDEHPDLAAGIYTTTVTDVLGCTKVFTDLELIEGGNLDLIDNTAICLGDSVDLFLSIPPGATLTYFSPTDGLNCDPCIPPFKIYPTTSNTYEVRMEDASCTYEGTVNVFVDELCIWPGDTDTNKVVNLSDLLPIGLAHGATGPQRPNASLNWEAQPGPAWMQTTPLSQVDYKHIDTNGDGFINDADTTALNQNLGEMHDFRKEDGEEKENMGIPLYVQVDTLLEGETYALSVILGASDNPALDVYGLAFSLYFDPDIIVDGSASLTTENSWLGTQEELLLMQRTDDAVGQLDVAFTRRDGISVDDFGQIASFNITIEDDIFFKSNGGDQQLLDNKNTFFEIRGVKAIDEKEKPVDTDPMDTEATLDQLGTGTHAAWLATKVEVYPNPSSDLVEIQSGSIDLEKIVLYDARGEQLEEWLTPQNAARISIAHFAEGVYCLEVHTAEGVLMERLVVLK